jgi:hypothetical protein
MNRREEIRQLLKQTTDLEERKLLQAEEREIYRQERKNYYQEHYQANQDKVKISYLKKRIQQLKDQSIRDEADRRYYAYKLKQYRASKK